MGDSAVSTKTQFPLSHRRILKRAVCDPVVLTLLAVVAVFAFAHPMSVYIFTGDLVLYQNPGLLVSVLTACVLVVFYVYQHRQFSRFTYEASAAAFMLAGRDSAPHELQVPYADMAEVRLAQRACDRLFGLFTVEIVRTDRMIIAVDGLERAAAQGLRDLIAARAQRP